MFSIDRIDRIFLRTRKVSLFRILLVFVFLFIPVAALHADESGHDSLSSHLGKAYKDDLEGLLKRHYVRVLTTFNRTNFFLAGGRQHGFEYSLLKGYEKFLNKGKKRGDLRIVIEFIPVPRDQLMPKLLGGYGDIAAAGLTITPERQKTADFTDPYLTGINEIIVSHKDVKGLNTLDDLSGKEILVRESSSYFESIHSLNGDFAQRGMKPVKVIKADEDLETEDILELVHSGAVKITIADSHIAKIWSKILNDIRLHPGLILRSGSKIAWMVRKDAEQLKKNLNAFLKTHKRGTLLGNIYFNRYYKNTKWIRNPLVLKERAKIGKFKDLFRKYAGMYGFDWMLIMAAAYKESRLDNRKKNPSGAVGIMQVLPSTARDRNIGITDVHKVENNIHAGVKYLAFLRDRYFSKGTMSERDRIRFTLAAYNAGPAKIRQARSLATTMGLDPNKWFRNVEMAALKMVGQETVQYVSSINKYYVIFRSYFKRQRMRDQEKEKIL